MDISAEEIDLEYIEQDMEERLTEREAALFGLAPDAEKEDPETYSIATLR